MASWLKENVHQGERCLKETEESGCAKNFTETSDNLCVRSRLAISGDAIGVFVFHRLNAVVVKSKKSDWPTQSDSFYKEGLFVIRESSFSNRRP